MSVKLITQNLLMVEYAPKDPRSASAMLGGKGDGRELVWLNFEKAHPEITDQEILMANFSHEARYGRVKVADQSLREQGLKLMMCLIGLVIIVF